MIYILIIFFLTLLLNVYFVLRNRKVFEFRVKVLEKCLTWNLKHIESSDDAQTFIYSKLPSYRKMLFDIRPLRLDRWVPEKDLKKLFDE